jgi:hypothetical protein
MVDETKIEIYEAVIVSFVLFGDETYCLWEEQRLKKRESKLP